MVQANKLAALVLIVPGHTTYVGLKSHVSDTEFGACEETMYEKVSRDVTSYVFFTPARARPVIGVIGHSVSTAGRAT